MADQINPLKRKPLNREQEFFQALATALAPSTEAVTIADRDGYILWANEQVVRVYRRKIETILGKHPLTFCPLDFSQKFSQEIFEAIHQQGGWDGVVINVDAKGRRFPILLRTVLVAFARKGYVISWAKPFPEATPFMLSKKQAACFHLLGQGFKVKEIAGELKISLGTVKAHLERVKKAIAKAQMEADAKSRGTIQIDLEHLAVRCLEAGWSPFLEINEKIN